MHRLRILFLLVVIAGSGTRTLEASDPPSVASLAVTVAGDPREFSFTNKGDLFYHGVTGSLTGGAWQGLWVSGRRILTGFQIMIDGNPVPDPDSVTVFPDYAVYHFPGDLMIEVRLVDNLPICALHVIAGSPVEAGIGPRMPETTWADDILLRSEHVLIGLSGGDEPVWLAMHAGRFAPKVDDRSAEGDRSPLLVSVSKSRRHVISFAVSPAMETAAGLASSYENRSSDYADARRERIQRLLDLSPVRTSNMRFDRALAWAKLSLDALIMNDRRKGIYAGLPWFNNYWGRDTFISLPGALLVTGQFEEAKEILRTFAALQERDSASDHYGRIPNVVNPDHLAFNTADGTPRFILQAREYIERSGDASFLAEIYPTVLRSIEGTVRYHTDSLGFLTHGDAETWMDAAGPNGPWSPRGNRANDVQALWLGQLETGIWFAAHLGDRESAGEWRELRDRLKSNFPLFFVASGQVTDHLNSDGTCDHQLRPNQIFASALLDADTRARVTRQVVTGLTYPHGVASLSSDDPAFHPFHQYPLYPKDAAYHNGTVWTWVQGALISELCFFGRQDLAYRLTRSTVDQILDRGAVGSQSELLDAVPREGEQEPRLSGTFTQAWNLAEFIRNMYDDYLGIRVNRFDHQLRFTPRIPPELGNVSASINLGGGSLPVAVTSENRSMRLTVDGSALRNGGLGNFNLQGQKSGEVAVFEIAIPPGARITIEQTPDRMTVTAGDSLLNVQPEFRPIPGAEVLGDLPFAIADFSPDLPALRGPAYPLIPHSVVVAESDRPELLMHATDPLHDDVGEGTYTYPLDSHFIPGSFDISGFEASHDQELIYFELSFRALSNPGWHPEYGFQLTEVVIALHAGTDGSIDVGHNSGMVLDRPFQRLILVGGGIQIEDDAGTILAAYLPSEEDAVNPIGDASTGTIRFALPLKYFPGGMTSWSFSVMAGGQDDHGGAGIGEFRTVGRTATRWSGGGRENPESSNIYDFLRAVR